MARTGSKGGKRANKGAAAKPKPVKAESRPERRKSSRQARTATGKKADPSTLAAATIGSQEGLRERTEAGHRAAGRTPPSQVSAKKTSGATRVVDDDIRSYAGLTTE